MSDRATFFDDLEAAGVRVRRPSLDWRSWSRAIWRSGRAGWMTAKAFQEFHLSNFRPPAT